MSHGASSQLRGANLPEHESRALRERPAGHDRREAAGRSTGHHDLDVVRRTKLRDRRGAVRGVRELPEHVLGEPLPTVPAREQLTDRALDAPEEPPANGGLLPAPLARGPP